MTVCAVRVDSKSVDGCREAECDISWARRARGGGVWYAVNDPARRGPSACATLSRLVVK